MPNGEFATASLGNVTNISTTTPLQKQVSSVVRSSKTYDLDRRIVDSFAGGRYNSRILEKDIIVYRAGSSTKVLGNFFSKDKPLGALQVRIDKAIKPSWGQGVANVVDTVYEYRVQQVLLYTLVR